MAGCSGICCRSCATGAFLSSFWLGGGAICGLGVADGGADLTASASIFGRSLNCLGTTLCSNICFRSSGPGTCRPSVCFPAGSGFILTLGSKGRGAAVGVKIERSRSLTIGLAPPTGLPGNDRRCSGGRFTLGISLIIGILVIRPGSILGWPILIRSRKKGFSRCPIS